LFNPHAEVLFRSGRGVGAVGESAVGVVGIGSGNAHSILGLGKVRYVAGIGERIAEDDDGSVIRRMIGGLSMARKLTKGNQERGADAEDNVEPA
jgi:hypothetical protein